MRSEAEIIIDDLPTDEEIAERIENHPCMSCRWNVLLDCTVPSDDQCPAKLLNTPDLKSKENGSEGGS